MHLLPQSLGLVGLLLLLPYLRRGGATHPLHSSLEEYGVDIGWPDLGLCDWPTIA